MELKDLHKLFLQSGKICTDSRKINEGSIFFALKGENFNGNDFAIQALEKGCVAAVIDENPDNGNEKLILVDNVLETLQNLARFHRKLFDVPVIAITGTNGKTTTKELIAAVLSTGFNVLATEGNLNNHIGVPLTLLRMTEDTEGAIIEMGANHEGEISELCKIALPDYGLITNIGSAHLEGFGSPDGVVRAKNELYNHIRRVKGKLFVNYDDKLLSGLSHDISKITYGKEPEADVQGSLVEDMFTKIQWWTAERHNEKRLCTSGLIGDYNFYNIMAAICIGYNFGIKGKEINNAIIEYKPKLNRSQFIETESNRVIMDAYNANPDSMKAALLNLSKIEAEKKVIVLGDMFELGAYSKEAHAELVMHIQEMDLARAFLVGKEFYSHKADNNITFFNDVEEVRKALKENPVRDAVVLLKGSRAMAMEQLLELL